MMIQHLLFYFSELSISVLQITTIGSIFSVTFCQQQQKVTKERRRRCILAKIYVQVESKANLFVLPKRSHK